MKRGPKPKPPEQRIQYKTLAIDAELIKIISKTSDELAPSFGFRPTLSQTLRHILKKVQL